MQPCHGALPHQWAASSHSCTQYSGIPCGHAQPCQLQVPVQFVGAHAVQYSLGPLQTTPPHLQHRTTPMQFQGCSGRHHTAEPARKREINTAYCLVDKEGQLKPFSSVTQLSGGSYEGMLSMVLDSGGAWILSAVCHQEHEERLRLEESRNAVAELLRQTVSDRAVNDMTAKGVAEEQAEVDTVFNGSFNAFAESIKALSEVKVSATCEQVQSVLVQICSDSRFVAMKLYQIEIQSCLVARQGFLVENSEPWRRQELNPQTTGFAIIFNRAALQIDTQGLATQFGLTNVRRLLEEKKLHIAYFLAESALPAALSMAREADKKAAEADKKAAEAEKEATEARNEVRQLKDELQGEGLFSVSLKIDCFVCELIWDELQVQFFRNKTWNTYSVQCHELSSSNFRYVCIQSASHIFFV